MPSLSPAILSIIASFAILFSRPVWNNALTLFIVCLIANRLQEERAIEVDQTAWYEKKDAAFSDLL